jgi:hypothetical protein
MPSLLANNVDFSFLEQPLSTPEIDAIQARIPNNKSSRTHIFLK